ncbi:hypothetical protein BDZ89DRAFT_1048492 [Hymenopellis radicata]|nr:hypothetical protein BDZ89DRAFT_1048492 [Hymenopellis radicata]
MCLEQRDVSGTTENTRHRKWRLQLPRNNLFKSRSTDETPVVPPESHFHPACDDGGSTPRSICSCNLKERAGQERSAHYRARCLSDSMNIVGGGVPFYLTCQIMESPRHCHYAQQYEEEPAHRRACCLPSLLTVVQDSLYRRLDATLDSSLFTFINLSFHRPTLVLRETGLDTRRSYIMSVLALSFLYTGASSNLGKHPYILYSVARRLRWCGQIYIAHRKQAMYPSSQYYTPSGMYITTVCN